MGFSDLTSDSRFHVVGVLQDGHVYERHAIEKWLRTRNTSPNTNDVMGTALVSAVLVRQTVAEIIEAGGVDAVLLSHVFMNLI